MGNNDQKREATHQNESMSQNRDFTLTQLKVWHRQRGRMALVEVPARFNYGMPSRLSPTSFWQLSHCHLHPSPIYLFTDITDL